jgi:hypothetical protein
MGMDTQDEKFKGKVKGVFFVIAIIVTVIAIFGGF